MGKRIAVALTVIVATATACSSSHTTTASTQPGATSTGSFTSQSAGPLNVGKASVPDHITAAGVTPPHGRTYTPPKSIAGNCSADVTDALQAWFDSVPDGSTVSLPAHACYRIEGTVMLEDRHDLLLDGHGATLQAKTAGAGKKRDRNRCQLVLRSSSNITVQDLIVRGANPHAGTSKAAYVADLEAQHAFKLSGDDGVFLDRVQAYDTYGDFVNIAGRKGTPSKNITVARSTFDRSGRQGISFTKSEDVLIVGNEIGNVARSLFDIELDKKTSSARRIRIVANTTGPVHNFWLANKGAGVDVGDVAVTGNVTRGASGGGVFVFGPLAGKRGPFTFADNVFQVTGRVSDEGSRGVFYFRNTDHVTIRHNEVHAPPDRKMPAVELHASSDATIAGNKFVGTAKPVLADTASKNVKAS